MTADGLSVVGNVQPFSPSLAFFSNAMHRNGAQGGKSGSLCLQSVCMLLGQPQTGRIVFILPPLASISLSTGSLQAATSDKT